MWDLREADWTTVRRIYGGIEREPGIVTINDPKWRALWRLADWKLAA